MSDPKQSDDTLFLLFVAAVIIAGLALAVAGVVAR